MFKKENYQIHENFLKENLYKKIHVTCKKLKYKKIYQVKKNIFPMSLNSKIIIGLK